MNKKYMKKKAKHLPHVGAIVNTPDGKGEVDNVETLREVVRVKIKDGDIIRQKRYNIDEIKIIKDVNSEEETNEEEAEYKQELNELETLEEQDKKNKFIRISLKENV